MKLKQFSNSKEEKSKKLSENKRLAIDLLNRAKEIEKKKK